MGEEGQGHWHCPDIAGWSLHSATRCWKCLEEKGESEHGRVAWEKERKPKVFFSVEFKCFLWRWRTKSCHMSRPPLGWVCGEEQDLAAAHTSSFAESAYFPETAKTEWGQEGFGALQIWEWPVPKPGDSRLSQPPYRSGNINPPLEKKILSKLNYVTPCEKKTPHLQSPNGSNLFGLIQYQVNH